MYIIYIIGKGKLWPTHSGPGLPGEVTRSKAKLHQGAPMRSLIGPCSNLGIPSKLQAQGRSSPAPLPPLLAALLTSV